MALDFHPPYLSEDAIPLGDVNADGYNDFAFTETGRSVLALFLGNYQVSSEPAWVLHARGGPPYLPAITAAAGLGDVNGDGIDDFALGAKSDDVDGTRGQVVVLSGDPTMRVGVEEPGTALPQAFTLSAFPNPFNSATTIRLAVPGGVPQAELKIVNLLGQTVAARTLALSGGQTEWHWDAGPQASGLYFVMAEAGPYQTTQKLMLLK